jgi:two-component system, OmpR family, phosphate regulon sensor histidine kinase PhoR
MVVQKEKSASSAGEINRSALQRESDFHATLLAMAGHDLRQPLQVILGTYSWLARRRTADRELEYIQRGMKAAVRLAEHLDHLIDALRQHEPAAGIALKPVRVEQLFANVCESHADLAHQKGLRLGHIPTSMMVMSDEILLQAALHNLVRNAVNYTASGGRIVVGCRRLGSVVRIEVHDTGIGIPRDHLSKVFDAFHRVHSTQSDGLGLGLFIVRRTADLLGHRIEVRSSEGRGTCFSVLAEAAVMTSASSFMRNLRDNDAIDLRGFSAPDPLPMHHSLVAISN